jgi:hypothetical protein
MACTHPLAGQVVDVVDVVLVLVVLVVGMVVSGVVVVLVVEVVVVVVVQMSAFCFRHCRMSFALQAGLIRVLIVPFFSVFVFVHCATIESRH